MRKKIHYRTKLWLFPQRLLITKNGLRDAAATSFANTGVNVTTDGRPYLGAALGTQEYIASQVESKVNEWTANLQCLANIAESQPHAAFSALMDIPEPHHSRYWPHANTT